MLHRAGQAVKKDRKRAKSTTTDDPEESEKLSLAESEINVN